MDSLTDSGECARENWGCLCSSLALQQKDFLVGYIWISQYSNCAHHFRVLPVLSGKRCASAGCVCLSDLVQRAAGCLCREVFHVETPTCWTFLCVLALIEEFSLHERYNLKVWLFYFSASQPLTQTYKKLFACLSICSKIFSSVFSLSCAVCRFFSSCYKNIVNVVEKRFWQKEREEILVLMHDSAKSKCSACGQVLCKHLHLQSCFQVQRDLFSICLCAFIFILSLHRFSTKHSGGIKFYKKCGFLVLFLWGASEVGSSMRKAVAQQRKESWAKIWEYF